MNRPVRLIAPVLALALVCLAAGPENAGKPRKVVIDHLKYEPAKLTIKVGQTVLWVNKDDHDHTVVGKVGKKDAFESENLGRDETFKHTFDKPGTYEYFCRYHPRMKGVVIVME